MVDSGSGRPVAADRRQARRQHEGRRHRPGQDRHHPDLAFPSRPHLRADGEGHQRARVPQRRARGRQRHRVQVVDRARPRREAAGGAARPLGTRIKATFPTWKNFKLVEGEKEVAPGVRLVSAPGHTPGHAAFHVSSRQPAADDLQRHRLCAGAARAASGVAGRLRPGRPAGRGVAPQAARSRDRRQDDDLRRALPVPGRRLVRQGRQRLRVHAGARRRRIATADLARCRQHAEDVVPRSSALRCSAGRVALACWRRRRTRSTPSATRDAPDLTAVRAKIKAKDWKARDRRAQRHDRQGRAARRRLQSAGLQPAQERRPQARPTPSTARRSTSIPSTRARSSIWASSTSRPGELAKAREHVVLLRSSARRAARSSRTCEKAIAEAPAADQDQFERRANMRASTASRSARSSGACCSPRCSCSRAGASSGATRRPWPTWSASPCRVRCCRW